MELTPEQHKLLIALNAVQRGPYLMTRQDIGPANRLEQLKLAHWRATWEPGLTGYCWITYEGRRVLSRL